MGSAGDGWTTIVVVAASGAECTIGRVERDAPPDLSVVDALARLQVAARRRGLSVRLRNSSPDLRALLDLVGLADVIVDAPSKGLPLEPVREAEDREQLGIEEVVMPRDPPA